MRYSLAGDPLFDCHTVCHQREELESLDQLWNDEARQPGSRLPRFVIPELIAALAQSLLFFIRMSDSELRSFTFVTEAPSVPSACSGSQLSPEGRVTSAAVASL